YKQLRNATVTLGNALNISESIDLSGGVATNRLASNNNLTLLSTQNLTANVFNLGLSSITGSVNVQRYITGGSSAYRGYRLITSPVTMATGVFNLAFLKNSTLLSGATGGGFDRDGNPSVYLYREDIKPSAASFVSGNFKGVAKINNADVNDIGTQKRTTITNIADTTVRLAPANGLLYFFRGDRINNLSNKTQAPFAIPETVTLTATGTLNQGNIPVKPWHRSDSFLGYTNNALDNANVRGYNLVGNPYASTIDWNSNSAAGGTGILFSNANDIDPKIFYLNNAGPGQNYIWYDSSTGLSSDPKASRYITSGQGFFVRAKSASATLTFTENAKAAQQVPTLLMGIPVQTATIPGFYIRLSQDSSAHDYCSVYFDTNWSENYTDEDAPDTDGTSPQLFLSTFSADGERLALNKSRLAEKETMVNLYVDGSHSGNFTLNLEQIRNLPADQFDIILHDMYKLDSVKMNGGQSYAFYIDKSDNRTFGAKRFVLAVKKVLQNKPATNAARWLKTASSLTVYPNPA
ncbi:MAG: hypothetical protein INR69_24080, partial [Mucilaginibacter polytrichastri]|nr:hypothetical protein [Mucilaginibacter polytrichastri]